MSDDLFHLIHSKTLRDDVVDIIRQAILRGDLLPGTKINQAKIAEQLGTSRGPVREALGQLQKEGLITSIPYKGTFVIEITPTYIEELYSIRRSLENFAIRRLIEQATPEDIEKLRAIVAKMEQVAHKTDLNLSVELDLEFHYLLCKSAHHGLLIQMWKSIEAGVRICLTYRHRVFKDPREVLLDAHPDILAAIKAKDVSRASQILDDHIRKAGEAMYSSWVDSTKTSEST